MTPVLIACDPLTPDQKIALVAGPRTPVYFQRRRPPSHGDWRSRRSRFRSHRCAHLTDTLEDFFPWVRPYGYA